MCSINVFIPETIKNVNSGFLSGKYLMGNYDAEDEAPALIIDEKIQENAFDDSVGEISNGPLTRSRSKAFWVVLETEPSLIVSSFILDGKIVHAGDVNLVFYNSSQIKHSYLLYDSGCHRNSFSKDMDFFIQRVKMDESETKRPPPSYFERMVAYVMYLALTAVLSTWSVLRTIKNMLAKFSFKSFTVDQFLHRCQQGEKLLKRSSDGKEDLIWKRIVGVWLVDILFGFLSCYFIYDLISPAKLHSWFHSSAKVASSHVQDLLSWLSGAPAGLKLNQPLTEFLASFFSYHVYLWTLYLEVAASPLLAFMARFFTGMAVFGISLQIAFVVDALKFAVVHIDCIYIYAARLHMLQMSLLGSQWRAFTGRKWNPLKKRVDTPSERRQRPLIKVISAVGFTLVVFLLPTTAIYYLVFVTLRLVLVSMEGLVSVLLWALNSNPVYIVCLHMMGSPLLKGKFHFEMEPFHDIRAHQRPIYLKLTTKASPLREAIEAAHSSSVFPPRPSPNMGRVLNSLLYAEDLL